MEPGSSQVDFRWSQVHHRWTLGGARCITGGLLVEFPAQVCDSRSVTLCHLPPSCSLISEPQLLLPLLSQDCVSSIFLQQKIVMLLLTHLSFHSHSAALHYSEALRYSGKYLLTIQTFSPSTHLTHPSDAPIHTSAPICTHRISPNHPPICTIEM